MIRSAAKNHAGVIVVVDPADYTRILADLGGEGVLLDTRRFLAAKAYTHTGQYDATISQWLTRRFASESPEYADALTFPSELALGFKKSQNCRYGENPHQRAAFYISSGVTEPSVSNAVQIHGKELSFNNIYDLNGALETVKEFSEEKSVGCSDHQAYQSLRRCTCTYTRGGILKSQAWRPDLCVRRNSRGDQDSGCCHCRGDHGEEHVL